MKSTSGQNFGRKGPPHEFVINQPVDLGERYFGAGN
jgi:hypothetical protein